MRRRTREGESPFVAEVSVSALEPCESACAKEEEYKQQKLSSDRGTKPGRILRNQKKFKTLEKRFGARNTDQQRFENKENH